MITSLNDSLEIVKILRFLTWTQLFNRVKFGSLGRPFQKLNVSWIYPIRDQFGCVRSVPAVDSRWSGRVWRKLLFVIVPVEKHHFLMLVKRKLLPSVMVINRRKLTRDRSCHVKGQWKFFSTTFQVLDERMFQRFLLIRENLQLNSLSCMLYTQKITFTNLKLIWYSCL